MEPPPEAVALPRVPRTEAAVPEGRDKGALEGLAVAADRPGLAVETLHLALASEAEHTQGAALPVAVGHRVAAQPVHKLLEPVLPVPAAHILLPEAVLPAKAADILLPEPALSVEAEHIRLPAEAAHMALPELKQAPEASSAKT